MRKPLPVYRIDLTVGRHVYECVVAARTKPVAAAAFAGAADMAEEQISVNILAAANNAAQSQPGTVFARLRNGSLREWRPFEEVVIRA